MSRALQIGVAGLVAIGLATAILAPGRQTIGALKATGSAGQGLFKGAEGR